MPPLYIFPCSNCDHKFELVAKQAGLELTCPQCQQALEAPMLGKMKRRELVSGTEPIKKPAKGTGRGWKNFLFAAGLATSIIAAAAGFGLSYYANTLDPRYEREAQLENFEYAVDNISPSQLVEFYQEMDVESGLGEWYEPNYVRYGKQVKYLRWGVPVMYGLAGLGFLVMIGSFILKK